MPTRIVFDVGDQVGYPVIHDFHSERKMTVIDKQVNIYKKSGKMFTRYLCPELLERLAEDVHTNVQMEYDNLICIDGKEGSGKSNLAVALCRAIDPNWDLEKNYIYNYAEFVDAITNGEVDDNKRVFLLDEGSLVANKRESMSEDSRRFIELLETMRSRGWTLVMCIPSADRLDIYIREHRMRYLLTAHEIAWDVVYTTKSRGFFELQFRRGSGLETFRTVAYGTFPRMSDEDRKVYNKLKANSQKRLMDKIAGKGPQKENRNTKIMSDQKKRLQNASMRMQEMGMSTAEIAEVLGCDDQIVRDYIVDGKRRKEAEMEGADGSA